MDKNIAVIGAGIGGLAAAIRLAIQGNKVELFEASAQAGGKLNFFAKEGYRFDMGPSLFTMPSLLHDIFNLANKNLDDYLQYQQLDVVCKYFFEDGTNVNAYKDQDKFANELFHKLAIEPKVTLGFLKKSKELFELTENIFLFNSLHRLSTYTNKKALLTLFKFHKINAFKNMHQLNSHIFKNEKAVQIFDRFATYNGSNPYEAPATLNIIPHLEHNIGAFFPKNGMYGITEALFQLALEQGVKFVFNAKVESILTKNQKACGIKINGISRSYDAVVSNMDVVPTYQKLLANHTEPKIYTQQSKSTSALIFYWGINKTFKELDLHNILFSDKYKQEFESLFNDKTIIDDPTVYIFISNKVVKEDAPKCCENWFVMINAPHMAGQNWNELINMARSNIIKKINRILKININDYILFEKLLSPEMIEKNTSSHLGALYGANSNGKLSAFLRHPNFSSTIKNLFFVGGSVHPGGGIPLCLASAQIVDNYIKDVGIHTK